MTCHSVTPVFLFSDESALFCIVVFFYITPFLQGTTQRWEINEGAFVFESKVL